MKLLIFFTLANTICLIVFLRSGNPMSLFHGFVVGVLLREIVGELDKREKEDENESS